MTKPSKGRPAGKTLSRSATTRSSTSSAKEDTSATASATEEQQRLLKLFKVALNPGKDDHAILQEIKGHLYNRDFALAFGQPKYLRVYASRWSPSRALGYCEVFHSIARFVLQSIPQSEDDTVPSLNVSCIGGGAGAEQAALVIWLASNETSEETSSNLRVQLTLLDIASWNPIVSLLHTASVKPRLLSKYASEAARAANKSLLTEEQCSVRFVQADVLGLDCDGVRTHFADAHLITMMFTLNELYKQSTSRTQQFLTALADVVQTGSLLLVVDSPGSYSMVTLNGKQSRYPMAWLLDHTMIGRRSADASNAAGAKWEKLVSDDSKWFRMPIDLHYPIELENMRYQVHLYRRLARSDMKYTDTRG